MLGTNKWKSDRGKVRRALIAGMKPLPFGVQVWLNGHTNRVCIYGVKEYLQLRAYGVSCSFCNKL
ncbi:hypothetical protein SBA1_20133 [Candidatus Sulfotelmatobacter kueseliae]|uniref:Uncharacterized protein n=1 Tax=Candidatus Sulfotelmatobacter kueseliae TaxID=2042962 RepID=A0A2U3KFI5_9BACT|nr:hypothetical protein SBA1_20133 [Candidatus Sulfotelmatobacter kueseliae]